MIKKAQGPVWYLWFTYDRHVMPAAMSLSTCRVSAHSCRSYCERRPWRVSEKLDDPHTIAYNGKCTQPVAKDTRNLTMLIVDDIFILEMSATDTATNWTISRLSTDQIGLDEWIRLADF